jgi:DNA-binding NtrC family response regulator
VSKILIVDDDIASCRTLQLHFHSANHTVELAYDARSGLSAAESMAPEVIIMDIRMPGQSGLEALPDFKSRFPKTPVIMITAFDDMDSTITAMQLGADDYIAKPIDIGELDQAVERAITRRESSRQGFQMEPASQIGERGYTIIGNSRLMKEIFKTIGLVSKKPVTVLIQGASGTGKELVARNIHRVGPTPNGPFVAINCAALVETLLESDMFGHEKGAFTGAVSSQPGKFAIAQDGTILLDEVGELSPNIQAKLLRVLQEKEYIPVGGKETTKTNARVISASNTNLKQMVDEGRFREDLYYRLQVVSIQMPALKDHLEDLPLLIPHLLGRINREFHRSVSTISPNVMEAFYAYDWPGNVRELENLLMKAVAMCAGDSITLDLLPPEISKQSMQPLPILDVHMSLRQVEKDHVLRVLQHTGWHRGRACEILGTSRPRLRRLINQYALEAPDDSVTATEGD